jgi:hypothetical protein
MPTIFDGDLLGRLASTHGHASDAAASDQPVRVAARRSRGRVREEGEAFIFIRVDVRHAFCNRTGEKCDHLTLAPTAETSRRLAMFGMAARWRPDGMDILWNTRQRDQALKLAKGLRAMFDAEPEGGRGLLVDTVSASLFEPPLLFTVTLSNPEFVNLTKMPSDALMGDPPLLLSNRNSAHLDEAAGRADLVVDWEMRITRPPDDAPRAAFSSDALQAAKPSPRTKKQPTPPEAEPVVPASGAAARESRELFRRSRHFALLELHFTRAPGREPGGAEWDGMPLDLYPGASSAAKTRKPGQSAYLRPCTYTIRFEARETRWRYFIAARDGSLPDAESLRILVDREDAGFRAAKERHVLPDGRPALCLARSAALPLQARPEKIFSLVGIPRGRAREGTLISRLPSAGTASISLQAAGADQPSEPPRAGEPPPAWSDIYVFL